MIIADCKFIYLYLQVFTAAHIFVFPGDAPAIITQYVAWMERQFHACQVAKPLAACTYLSSIVSELYDA